MFQIRRKPSKGSAAARASSTTRPITAPTVRQRHAHQLDHRRLRRMDRQPRHLIIKRSRMPGAVSCPWHRRHRHAMVAARHSGCVGLDEHHHRARVQGPPPPTALTGVISPVIVAGTGRTGTGSPSTHAPTPRLQSRQRPRGHPQSPRCVRHPARVPITSRSARRSPDPLFRCLDSSERRKDTACTRGWPTKPPTDQSGEPDL